MSSSLAPGITVELGTESDAWGDPLIACQRAQLESTVTLDNESHFRTYHPFLASAPCVLAPKERRTERYIWIILLTSDINASLIGTHAGDREIHFEHA